MSESIADDMDDACITFMCKMKQIKKQQICNQARNQEFWCSNLLPKRQNRPLAALLRCRLHLRNFPSYSLLTPGGIRQHLGDMELLQHKHRKSFQCSLLRSEDIFTFHFEFHAKVETCSFMTLCHSLAPVRILKVTFQFVLRTKTWHGHGVSSVCLHRSFGWRYRKCDITCAVWQ